MFHQVITKCTLCMQPAIGYIEYYKLSLHLAQSPHCQSQSFNVQQALLRAFRMTVSKHRHTSYCLCSAGTCMTVPVTLCGMHSQPVGVMSSVIWLITDLMCMQSASAMQCMAQLNSSACILPQEALLTYALCGSPRQKCHDCHSIVTT